MPQSSTSWKPGQTGYAKVLAAWMPQNTITLQCLKAPRIKELYLMIKEGDFVIRTTDTPWKAEGFL